MAVIQYLTSYTKHIRTLKFVSKLGKVRNPRLRKESRFRLASISNLANILFEMDRLEEAPDVGYDAL